VTEIRLDVDLSHPPERVWRAITDAKVLGQWFIRGGVRPVAGHRFRLRPEGQAGLDEPIDVTVVEAEPSRRLAMRWQAPELDTRVSITLSRVSGGCRLTLRQSGFLGMQGLMRRRVLHRTYTEMFGRRLPDTLNRLAGDDGRRRAPGAATTALARRRTLRARVADSARAADSGRRNAARPFQRRGGGRRHIVGRVRVSRPLSHESTVAIAIAAAPGGHRLKSHARRRRRERPEWVRVLTGRVLRTKEGLTDGIARLRAPVENRRGHAVVVGAGLLLVIGLVSVIVAAATTLYPAGPPRVGGGPDTEPGYAELPGRPHTSDSAASRTAATESVPGGAAAVASTGPVTVGSPLTAEYRTETVRLGGYRGVVKVTNPGPTLVTGWTVVISLPVLNLTIRDTPGAEHKQTGRSVTFTPTADTRQVSSGASVLFAFEVSGVGRPVACAVDGRPCSGVPE
jgi:uncharacterized protein YndB with AHSA1/START domain